MLLSISGASAVAGYDGGFWESWVCLVDRRGWAVCDGGGGIKEGRGAEGKTGKGGEEGGWWVSSEGRCCGCCHLWAQVPPDPSSWQAQRISQIQSSPANTVCHIPKAASNTTRGLSQIFTNLNLLNILKNCQGWCVKALHKIGLEKSEWLQNQNSEVCLRGHLKPFKKD